MPKDKSVRSGALPYDDGSGLRYSFEIDDEYIWVNGGSLMIETADWEAFRDAVEVGLNAFRQISK